MVEVSMVYEGQLRCRVSHGPSGQTLVTDAPVDNHGKGESFSPTDLIGTALGACILTIMGIVGERRKLDLSNLRIQVVKHMEVEPVRRIGRLEVAVSGSGFSEEVQNLLENAALTCPVHKSLEGGPIHIDLGFDWS
ncbi:MAG: OsmC family protein [Planctomycetes bacterium]|nr:OsmC family protein [Planctomycetota bacterium]